MKNQFIIVLFLLPIMVFAQNNQNFKEQLFDEEIEALKLAIGNFAISNSDTSSLNNLLSKFHLPARTDSIIRSNEGDIRVRTYKASLVNSINYLIYSESISYDSTIVRISRHSIIKELESILVPSDLETIESNSLILSLEEIGLIYDYKFCQLIEKDVWIEEILNYSNIEDGDRILIKGPNTSFGYTLILLSALFPNSEIVTVIRNSILRENFMNRILKFEELLSIKNIRIVSDSQIPTLSYDKIILMMNIENEVEFLESTSNYKSMMNKDSELIYFDLKKQDGYCGDCPGQLSSKDLKGLMKKNKLTEVEDSSFYDDKITHRHYVVKVYKK